MQLVWKLIITSLILPPAIAQAQLDGNLKIGIILPFSGPLKPYSTEAIRGVKIALEKFRKEHPEVAKRIKIIKADNGGSPLKTEQEAENFFKKARTHVLFGPISGVNSLPLAKIAQKYKKPYISPIANDPVIARQNKWTFQSGLTLDQMGSAVAKFARENLKRKRMAILIPNNVTYQKLPGTQALTTFNQLGGTAKTFPEETDQNGERKKLSTSQLLSKVKAWKPDIIFFPGFAGQASELIRQSKKFGIKSRYIGTYSWDNPQINDRQRKNLQNHYYVTPFTPSEINKKTTWFLNKFIDTWQHAPQHIAALSYDGMSMILEAFLQTGSNRAPVLQKALARGKEFQTLSGQLSMSANGILQRSGAFVKITSRGPKFIARIPMEENRLK